jgi:hypothetical protein
MNLRLFTKIPPYPFWGFFDHSKQLSVAEKIAHLSTDFRVSWLSFTERIPAV